MIATLKGEITAKTDSSLIVEIGGIGYEVAVTVEDWGGHANGDSVFFHIHEHIREDAHVLYGFSDIEAKQLFGQLLGVSGVGPKVAMGTLSAAGVNRLKQAIAAGDPDMLKGVSGVGKKTAERIMIELKGKISSQQSPLAAGDETYQALLSLGYTGAQATEAIAGLPSELASGEERLKAALKGLAS